MRTPVPPYRSGLGSGTSGETFRAVSLPVLAGLLVRAVPVATSGFPLNDGGLFFAMTRDLQNANFLIPATTSYNGLAIPYVYPPLGFYVAGGLSSVFGFDLLGIFQFLPMIVATLAIPAFYLLAREILSTRFQALLATWAFALVPRSFAWLIAGGGLTRSFGILFAILTLWQAIRLFRTGRPGAIAGTGAFAALTALSHPQAAEFMGISFLLLLLAYGRSLAGLRTAVLAGALAVVLSAPWWLTVVAVHGPAPFVSGGQTGINLVATLYYLLTFRFTDEPYLPILAVLGFVGLLSELAARRFLLPVWLVTLFVVDERFAGTASMVPMAMLGAIGLADVVFARLPGLGKAQDDDPLWPAAVIRDRFGRLVLGGALAVGVIGAIMASTVGGSPIQVMPAQNRATMAWIAANTPPSARFMVVTGVGWFIDANGEWFPVLAQRVSLGTLQGYEWLGKDQWLAQGTRNDSLASCATSTAACLVKWASTNDATDAWIYLPRQVSADWQSRDDCCPGLRESLARSTRYEVVYDGAGGTIFRPTS